MSSAVIGALRVVFGADTAAFEKGVDRAARQATSFEKRMKKVGGNISSVGKKLTLGITTPILGAATAFGAAAHGMAKDSREIATSADVAGESFEKFQRQAHAAKTVGIEFEKLGDIFKDVRDRVGDFAATGGGPMADFFENIAPKVGVTADAFKDLSGKDALQLYYDSLVKAGVGQEEMVFYLEAMASDATNLIPLLEQNGAAFDKLGASANVITDEERVRLEKYNDAQEKLGEATEKLTIALVNSGILETVTNLVDRFAAFTSELAETNPGLLKAGIVFAGLAAAIGPVLVAIGSVVTIAPALAKAFGVVKVAAAGLFSGPLLVAAGVVTGIYLAWKNWDQIEPYITAVKDAVVDFWEGNVKPIFESVLAKVKQVADFFADYFGDQIKNTVGLVSSLMEGDFQGAWDSARRIVNRAVKAVLDVVGDMPARVTSHFQRLWSDIKAIGSQFLTTMTQMGVDIVTGLASGIRDSAKAVYDALMGVIRGGVDAVKDFLGIKSPSRLFKAIGGNITQGLAIGIQDGIPQVSAAIADITVVADDFADKTKKTTDKVRESWDQMAKGILGSIRGLVDGIKSGDVFSILEGVIGVFGSVAGTGAFGSKLQASFSGSSFEGGGYTGSGSRAGGLDGRGGFMAMLHPNETVIDHTRGGAIGAGQSITVNVNAKDAVLTSAVKGWVAEGVAVATNNGAMKAQADMRWAATRRVR